MKDSSCTGNDVSPTLDTLVVSGTLGRGGGGRGYTVAPSQCQLPPAVGLLTQAGKKALVHAHTPCTCRVTVCPCVPVSPAAQLLSPTVLQVSIMGTSGAKTVAGATRLLGGTNCGAFFDATTVTALAGSTAGTITCLLTIQPTATGTTVETVRPPDTPMCGGVCCASPHVFSSSADPKCTAAWGCTCARRSPSPAQQAPSTAWLWAPLPWASWQGRLL